MELESLKEMLNDSVSPGKTVWGNDLQQILSKRSKSTISKMKRNLFIELIGLIMLYTFIVFKFISEMEGIAWLTLGIGVFYFVYFIIKYRLLKQLECPSCVVRSNLSRQLNSLENLLRFYLWSGLLLIPIAALGSFWIGYLNTSSTELPQDDSFLLITSFVIVLISLLFCIPLYFFTKWYIRKLYGRHIDKLKKMMVELNEENTITN